LKNRRVIGPFLAWLKGPFHHHFCITCHNKKSVQCRFSTFCIFLTFSLSISHLQKNLFKKAACHLQKQKKRMRQNFTFILQNQNCPTKIDLTATAPLKHIWATRKQSQLHCQNHRWRKTAYSQRSHISPTQIISSLRSY